MEYNIRIERRLPYAPEQVWRALTEAKLLGAWFMPNDFEPELQRAFSFRMKPQRGWDGMTYCQVTELEPGQRLAYTYRGEASGEKTLACAGIHSRQADAVGKGIFTRLDTVLRFTLTPERDCDGAEQTTLLLEQTGFRGLQLMVVSVVMGFGWRKRLNILATMLQKLEPVAQDATTAGGAQTAAAVRGMS